MWLEAPAEETDEHGNRRRSTRTRDEGGGTPHGCPVSPLLSNLYMRRFVLGWTKLGYEESLKAYVVNYADDLVMCCRNRAEEALPIYDPTGDRIKKLEIRNTIAVANCDLYQHFLDGQNC